MKDAKGHGSDARGSNMTSAQRTNTRQDKIWGTTKRLNPEKFGGVAAHATGTNQVGTKTGWTPDEAERFLHSEGHVTNIGQISPEAQRHLDKLVNSGHAIKGEDPVWAGHHAVWQLVKPLPGYSKKELIR